MFTSKDHATAQMVRHPPDHAAERERFVEDLLAIMSVAEKAGQLVLLPIPEAGGDSEGAPLRAEMLQGRVGGLLGSGPADQLAALQRLAVEEGLDEHAPRHERKVAVRARRALRRRGTAVVPIARRPTSCSAAGRA